MLQHLGGVKQPVIPPTVPRPGDQATAEEPARPRMSTREEIRAFFFGGDDTSVVVTAKG